jgi:chromosome partitioning protein
LTTNLAVQAALSGLGVLVVDLDSQATSWSWGQKRQAELPQVVASQGAALPGLLREASAQGVDLVVVDTPPRADTVGVQAAKASDLVLVPCQPSDFDLEAMSASLVAAQVAGKSPYVILNAVPTSSGIGDQVAAALQEGGAPLCPVRLGLRMDYRHPLPHGLGAAEHNPRGKAAQELAALWGWICGREGMSALQREGVAA